MCIHMNSNIQYTNMQSFSYIYQAQVQITKISSSAIHHWSSDPKYITEVLNQNTSLKFRTKIWVMWVLGRLPYDSIRTESVPYQTSQNWLVRRFWSGSTWFRADIGTVQAQNLAQVVRGLDQTRKPCKPVETVGFSWTRPVMITLH